MNLLAVAALCLALLVPGLDAAVMLDASLQVGLNSVLQLTCTATSSLTVEGFSWHLNGAEIDVGGSRYIPTQTGNMGRLQIFNVEYADAGRYLCTAEYSDGTKENSTEREVMVVTQPVIQATTPVYAENGKTAHLSCSVNTSATSQWIFNGTVIHNGGRYSIMDNERNITLVIDTVTAQDAGEYVCRAANSVGSDQTTVVLQITNPPILEPLPSTMSFPKGSNFNLTCRVKVLLPLPKLVWRVNGSNVMTTLTDSMMVVEETAGVLTLVVMATTFDSHGTYTCTATNPLGMDTVSTEVIITDPGQPHISYVTTDNSPAAAYSIVNVQRGNDSGIGLEAIHYTIALWLVQNHFANLQVLWPASGNISHSEHDQAWRLRGELPGGQNKVELVVKVADASSDEGVAFTQLITMATFENSVGTSTATLTSLIALNGTDTRVVTVHDRPATDEVGVGLALYVTTPLLSSLTALSLVTACTLAITLYRAKRKKTDLHTDVKPPIYAAVTRPDIEDPAAAVTANQVNPSYIPLEQLMTSQAM